MVDVGDKPVSRRRAVASAEVRMAPETLALLQEGAVAKGEVLQVARLAGILAAKRTDELIPLCHTLPLDSVRVDFEFSDAQTLELRAEACSTGRTGVEMEALAAVTIAALTVYDMCKGVDRGISIHRVQLEEKRGGRSGHWTRGASAPTKKERHA